MIIIIIIRRRRKSKEKKRRKTKKRIGTEVLTLGLSLNHFFFSLEFLVHRDHNVVSARCFILCKIICYQLYIFHLHDKLSLMYQKTSV